MAPAWTWTILLCNVLYVLGAWHKATLHAEGCALRKLA